MEIIDSTIKTFRKHPIAVTVTLIIAMLLAYAFATVLQMLWWVVVLLFAVVLWKYVTKEIAEQGLGIELE